MQTLAPPTRDWPELSTLLGEQISTGNVTPQEEEEEAGKIGTGSEKPESLQGGSDPSDPEREGETGNEGAGT